MGKKILKIGVIVAGVVVLIGAIGVGAFLYATRPLNTDNIEAVANRFEPGTSWKRTSNNVQPPSRVCLSGKCDTLSRKWTRKEPIEKSEYIELLDKTGWNYQLPDNCSVGRIEGDGVPRCDVEVELDGYLVSISASYGLFDETSDIFLTVTGGKFYGK